LPLAGDTAAAAVGGQNVGGVVTFSSYVLGTSGQQVLKSFGFLPPGS
jgi:hypothetical protein